MKKLTNEEFLQRLKDKNIPYIPLEEYKTTATKIKWRCYKNPNHIFEATPNHILGGKGCPYCCGRKVFVGETDLWATNPNVAKMLENPNEGYMYTAFSNHRTNWKCPNCGHLINNRKIADMTIYGLYCPVCSDGVSYPEKFVANMLKQLEINFIYDRPRKWSKNKRYDFYIEQYNMIIECHGLQHYKEILTYHSKARSLEEEQFNDVFKQNIAFANGVDKYIVLDCRESNKEFLCNSILNSELFAIFDLFKVDWDKCDEHANKSYYMDILKYYNNGIKNPVEIAKMVEISHVSVLNALHKLNKNGLCEYNPKESVSSILGKKTICLEALKIFNSVNDASVFAGIANTNISAVCRDKQKTAGGYHWMYYEDYLKENSEDNYGEEI